MGDEKTLAHARAENGGRLASTLNHGEVCADERAVKHLSLGQHTRQLLGVVHVGHVNLGDSRDALLGDAGKHLLKDGTLILGQIGVALAVLDSGEDGLAGGGNGGHSGTPSCPWELAAPCRLACPPWTITNIPGYRVGSSRNSKFVGIVKCLVDRGAAKGVS